VSDGIVLLVPLTAQYYAAELGAGTPNTA